MQPRRSKVHLVSCQVHQAYLLPCLNIQAFNRQDRPNNPLQSPSSSPQKCLRTLAPFYQLPTFRHRDQHSRCIPGPWERHRYLQLRPLEHPLNRISITRLPHWPETNERRHHPTAPLSFYRRQRLDFAKERCLEEHGHALEGKDVISGLLQAWPGGHIILGECD